MCRSKVRICSGTLVYILILVVGGVHAQLTALPEHCRIWFVLDGGFGRARKSWLGVRVTRDRKAGTIELDQEQYLDKVLTKFGFPHAVHKATNISTLIDGYHDLRQATPEDRRIDMTWYREVIGSVMYAMVYKRPDSALRLEDLVSICRT
jgi:hypothetical protein